jgi:hypothetical protein
MIAFLEKWVLLNVSSIIAMNEKCNPGFPVRVDVR